MNEASSKSQSMASRIAYSFGAFGHDMFYGMLSTYFMMFVTGHLFNSNSGGQAAPHGFFHYDYHHGAADR